jgi:hypothetical protein
MPIDARIALGAQAPQMAQPIELYGNALKLQSMQRQNALAEQEMNANQLNQRRQAELLNFMQSAKDPYAEDVQMQLPRFGQPGIDMAAKLEERNRYRSETKLKQAEHEAKTLELTQAMLPAAMDDPNQYARVVEFVRSRDPAMADRMPPWSREGVLNLMTTAKDMVAQHRMTANEQSMETDRAAGRQYQQDTLKETGRHNRNQENLAREQYQSSIDPETQRRLAEAKKKGEEAAGKGPAATSAAAAQAFLTSAGYDPETGADAVSKLIPKSTGGLLQTAGAKAAGALNITTSGQEAIGQLASRSSKLVLDLLGGKLGAGVSNADREFMLQAVGDIGNSLLPTGVRLAAWNDLMSRMKTAAGGASAAASAAAPAAAGPRKTKSGVTFTVEE